MDHGHHMQNIAKPLVWSTTESINFQPGQVWRVKFVCQSLEDSDVWGWKNMLFWTFKSSTKKSSAAWMISAMAWKKPTWKDLWINWMIQLCAFCVVYNANWVEFTTVWVCQWSFPIAVETLQRKSLLQLSAISSTDFCHLWLPYRYLLDAYNLLILVCVTMVVFHQSFFGVN